MSKEVRPGRHGTASRPVVPFSPPSQQRSDSSIQWLPGTGIGAWESTLLPARRSLRERFGASGHHARLILRIALAGVKIAATAGGVAIRQSCFSASRFLSMEAVRWAPKSAI